jgi:hypothetical protein
LGVLLEVIVGVAGHGWNMAGRVLVVRRLELLLVIGGYRVGPHCGKPTRLGWWHIASAPERPLVR